MTTFSEPTSGAAKQHAALTFVLGACWVTIALFAMRQIQRFIPAGNNKLLLEVLSMALVALGLYRIGGRMVPELRPLSSIGFVERPTSSEELGVGFAVGWAISLALILPALLTLHMHSSVYADKVHLLEGLAGLMLLAVHAVTTQLVFTGLLFRSLVRATTESVAVILMSCLAGGVVLLTQTGDIWQAVFAAWAQLLFSIAALRTRAIWIPLGIQMAWGSTLLLLFGVPSFYWPLMGGPVHSSIVGPRALTGSYLGPEASVWAFPVLLLAVVALWRATRSYAWHYTFDPIEGAGYAMDVAPPREHTRMEAESNRQGPLVQIAPAAPPPQPSGTD